MSKMTMEQVRNICRKRSQQYGYWTIQKEYEQMADAIDAEIKVRGRPVMTVNHVSSAEHDLLIGMKLFAAPPAPKIEVTDAMVERGCRGLCVRNR